MKKISRSFFAKTFTLIFVMIIGVTLVSYLLIYLLLPSFYINRQQEKILTQFNEKLPYLQQVSNIVEESLILNQLLTSRSIPFTLLDEQGNTIINMQHYSGIMLQENSVTDDVGISMTETTDDVGISMTETTNDVSLVFNALYDYTLLELNYSISRVGNRIVRVNIPVQPLEDAILAIMDTYPIVISISIICSLLISLIFSKWVVTPMKKIRLATSQMTNLEPNVEILVDRNDEIGEVVSDINLLYQQLHKTIGSLESQITKYSDVENKKIEFLQTVSHEMKAPLVTASALIEGIIHKIPPYHENKADHLKELKKFLDKTIQLTKESLNLSEKYKEDESTHNLLELVEDISNLYGIILTSKQLKYSQAIPAEILITTKANIFQKVLSNLFSNATNHTDKNGQIKVTFHDNILSISNNCTPLNTSDVQKIFKPLTTQSANKHSTGLGLFIVQQLLLQLQIKHSFTPTPDNDGMVFKIHFPDEMVKTKS